MNSTFNIDLITDKDIKQLPKDREIDDNRIFEVGGKNFTDRGLFSTEVFGVPGTKERRTTLGKILLNTNILHPYIWELVLKESAMYRRIIDSKEYGKVVKGSIVPAEENDKDAFTGYNRFIKEFVKLKFKPNRDSISHKYRMKEFAKNTEDYIISSITVSPAGIRDYTIDDNGKPSEDEVNEYYRKVINMANLFKGIKNTLLMDKVNTTLQLNVAEIHKYYLDMLDGKKGLLQGTLSSRNVMMSSRNVLGSFTGNIDNVLEEPRYTSNTVEIGVYQYSMAILPITKYYLRLEIMTRIFSEFTATAKVIDGNTVKLIDIDTRERERFLDSDNLTRTVNALINVDKMYEVPKLTDVKTNNTYPLAYLYEDKDKVKLIVGDDILKLENTDNLRPARWLDIIYLVLAPTFNKYNATTTRYPVTNSRNINISTIKVTATLKSVDKVYIDSMGNEYNIEWLTDTNLFMGMGVNTTKYALLGADKDGDTMSAIPVLTPEGNKNANDILNSRSYYVDDKGRLYDKIEDISVGLFINVLNHA